MVHGANASTREAARQSRYQPARNNGLPADPDLCTAIPAILMFIVYLVPPLMVQPRNPLLPPLSASQSTNRSSEIISPALLPLSIDLPSNHLDFFLLLFRPYYCRCIPLTNERQWTGLFGTDDRAGARDTASFAAGVRKGSRVCGRRGHAQERGSIAFCVGWSPELGFWLGRGGPKGEGSAGDISGRAGWFWSGRGRGEGLEIGGGRLGLGRRRGCG